MKFLCLIGLLLICLPAIAQADQKPELTCTQHSQQLHGEQQAFVKKNGSRYEASRRAAQGWLDQVLVDHYTLRKKRLLAISKTMEWVDAYYWLWLTTDKENRESIRLRLSRRLEKTQTDTFHDLAQASEELFNGESLAYMRLAFLMERLSLDTNLYRKKMMEMKPRLNSHLSKRGPHQKISFHHYYTYFGYKEPLPLATAIEEGLVSRHRPAEVMSFSQAKQFAREIIATYDDGEKFFSSVFDAQTRLYLRNALDKLAQQALEKKQTETLSLLLTAIRLLRFVDLAIYRQGLSYLIYHQNSDGSWGEFKEARKIHGVFVERLLQLKTSSTALQTLALAFHPGWNKTLQPDLIYCQP